MSSGLGKTGKSWTWKRTGTAKRAHQTRETGTTRTQIWSQGSYEGNLAERKPASRFSGAAFRNSGVTKMIPMSNYRIQFLQRDHFFPMPHIFLHLCIFMCIVCVHKCIFRVDVLYVLSFIHLGYPFLESVVCTQEILMWKYLPTVKIFFTWIVWAIQWN